MDRLRSLICGRWLFLPLGSELKLRWNLKVQSNESGPQKEEEDEEGEGEKEKRYRRMMMITAIVHEAGKLLSPSTLGLTGKITRKTKVPTLMGAFPVPRVTQNILQAEQTPDVGN